ncbi:MAG: hypothetical protein H0W78_11775 [Planctomycetes bacterium]|jgi:hypothetical protein|nr:hypothetical protein [Planctomycetota bacterium]
MRHSAVLIMLALLLAGCDSPRTTMMDKTEAKRDERVLRVRVVKVYDNRNLDYVREPNISHIVDVDVLDGPTELIGKPLALPFDMFYTAKPPPQVGEEVVTTPAAWVTRNSGGKQRAFGQ